MGTGFQPAAGFQAGALPGVPAPRERRAEARRQAESQAPLMETIFAVRDLAQYVMQIGIIYRPLPVVAAQ